MAVGKIHEASPVKFVEQVYTLSQMIRDATRVNRRIIGRESLVPKFRNDSWVGCQALLAVKFPDRGAKLRRQVLAVWSRRQILACAGYCQKPRRNASGQLMLVIGNLVVEPVPSAIVKAEPVRIDDIVVFDVLAHGDLRVVELRSTAAGVVHAGHGEAHVGGGSVKSGLATTRMPDDGYTFRIHHRFRFNPV